MVRPTYHCRMSLASRQTASPPDGARWLVIFHQLPAKPDYLRVKVGRRLRALGAVVAKNSVYVLPNAPELREALGDVVREIHARGGQAVVCEARFVEGLSDQTAEDLFRDARDKEFAVIAEEARQLASTLRRKGGPTEARHRSATLKLGRLKRRFQGIVSKDLFASGGSHTAAGLLSLVEDRLQGVEVTGKPEIDLSQPPRGATWVTRVGLMVDRIASAWLIRRFIDPAARFKFVSGRGYRASRGELRFDMAGAEFTHEDDSCTFEVLLEQFRLRDSALKCIGEMVHDLDLGDGRYVRPETSGLGRMIVGIALTTVDDGARIAQGTTVLDGLYRSFRKQAR